MLVKKSPCEIFIFLVGISLFIFFAGFAIKIYFDFSRPAFEKSLIETLLNTSDDLRIERSLLSVVIAATCVVGDKQLQTSLQPLTRAIIDNSIHGLIGLFSALIILTDHTDHLHLAVVCMMMSSLIDLDHFFAARSLKLSDATSLPSRPFLHNSDIPLALIAFLMYLRLTSTGQDFILWLVMAIVAFTTHHLRDANRRGLWFAPLGSTPPLTLSIYVLLTLITPYLLKFSVPDGFKYSRVNTSVLDV